MNFTWQVLLIRQFFYIKMEYIFITSHVQKALFAQKKISYLHLFFEIENWSILVQAVPT